MYLLAGFDEQERIDLGKRNLQLIANEENQDRAQCQQNGARQDNIVRLSGAKTCG